MCEATDSALAARRLGITAMIGLLLAGPCALAATAGCEARAVRAQESIPVEKLANWEPVDDHTLLVWTVSDSRAHLVRLDHAIPGLRGAPIVFLVTRDHGRNVCACGRDEVMVPGGGTALITSIRYLSEKRTAELDPDAGVGMPMENDT